MPDETALTVQQSTPPPAPPVLRPADIKRRVENVRELYRQTMQDKTHYGIIPGCPKPSLWQPGAELIAAMMQFSASYTIRCDREPDIEKAYKDKVRVGRIRYTVTCALTHRPTGAFAGEGIGVANSWESKWIGQDTDTVEETILQMARKRAFVNAVRTAACASEIFTQDDDVIEGQYEEVPSPRRQSAPRPERQPAQDDSRPQDGPPSQMPDGIPLDPPLCPVCGGAMWDNRDRAKGTKAPKWKCKNATWDKETRTAGGCPGVVWHEHPEKDDAYMAAWADRLGLQQADGQDDEDPDRTF